AFLMREAPGADSWFITVPTTRSASGSVYWVPGPGTPPKRDGGETFATIDGAGHPVVARATRGGDFFYRFHFDLFYLPVLWSRWIVGTCAMFML
ncbi:PepSY domain-containing protein, partial [Pseudomonas sp. FW305-130]